jgi:hypothetical protein
MRSDEERAADFAALKAEDEATAAAAKAAELAKAAAEQVARDAIIADINAPLDQRIRAVQPGARISIHPWAKR